MEAHHGHEVVKNVGQETINLVLEKEVELDRLLEEAKAEADRIIEAAKQEAQRINDEREAVKKAALMQSVREEAVAEVQEVNAEAAEEEKEGEEGKTGAPIRKMAMEKNVAMTEGERAQVQELRRRAEQNVEEVVKLIQQEIIP